MRPAVVYKTGGPIHMTHSGGMKRLGSMKTRGVKRASPETGPLKALKTTSGIKRPGNLTLSGVLII